MLTERFVNFEVGFCDPVGEKSLWSTFDADLNGEKPFILVSSKLDSNSLFRERSSGHSHRLSNIVLLGLISAMSNGNMANLPKNIVFGMFGAESFGFAGSQRFVEDLTGFTCQKKDLHENCPLNVGKGCSSPCHRDLDFTKLDFNKIEAIIEYDTVGHLYNAGDYFLHADDTAQSSTLMSDFGVEFEAPVYNQTSQRTVKVLPAVQGIKLPPSSAMSFLKRKRNLPTIVVSDYNSEFQNK